MCVFSGLISLATALTTTFTGAADVYDLPPGVVETEAEPPAEEASTSSVATVPLAPSTNQGLSAANALAPVPGVFVRETQGPGSYAALSLRGSGPDNVAVVLDDLPLDSATLGFVDLSMTMAESIERIEVYRGLAPVRYPSPLGGVVRLIPPAAGDKLRLRATAGAGSASTYQTTLAANGPLGDWGATAFVGYRQSRGNFRYHDDRATYYNADDDVVVRRANNDQQAGQLRLTATHAAPAGSTFHALVTAAARNQGIAGTGQARATAAHTAQQEGLSRLGLRQLQGFDQKLQLDLAIDALYSERNYFDPADEMGLAIRKAQANLLQGGVDLNGTWIASLQHESSLYARLSQHQFEQRSQNRATSYDPLSERLARTQLSVGLSHRAEFLSALIVEPTLRADAIRDTGSSGRPLSEWSPRVGARWEAAPCALRGSGGRSHRFPSLLERFGDMVTSRGAPDLEPETSWSADLGARCNANLAETLTVRAEFGLYRALHRNLIVPIATGAGWVTPQNIGRTRNQGIEASLQVDDALLHVTVGYAFLDARDRSSAPAAHGKQLPGFPRHRVNAHLALGNEQISAFYDVDLATQVYLDRANLQHPVPWRCLSNVGARLVHAASGVAFDLSVRNLFNSLSHPLPRLNGSERTAALADFLGYPIPGRSFFAGLSWSMP